MCWHTVLLRMKVEGNDMQKVISYEILKLHFDEWMQKADQSEEPIVIERQGKSRLFLLSEDAYQKRYLEPLSASEIRRFPGDERERILEKAVDAAIIDFEVIEDNSDIVEY